MKYEDRELVDGTTVVIGRKVQFRKDKDGNTVSRVSKTFTAEFHDSEGVRRFRGLQTTHKREARRLAIEIQRSLDDGKPMRRSSRLTIDGLIKRYTAFNESKGLAKKTLAKYGSDLEKLSRFCAEHGIAYATGFTEERYHQFGSWLRSSTHKQAATYAPKSVSAALVLYKQMFKWAHRHRIIPENPISAAEIPFAKARSQPCFTTDQVEAMLDRCRNRVGWEDTHDAIAVLAYTGMRVNELATLRWDDVLLDRGSHGMIRVVRGGSHDAPKDRDSRVIPIFKRIRAIFDQRPRGYELVFPDLRDRTLLARVKRLCIELGYGSRYKVHSFRHHFVSWLAAEGVPIQQCLQFTGHASWAIARQYYSLNDEQADRAIQSLSVRVSKDQRTR